MNNLFFQLM